MPPPVTCFSSSSKIQFQQPNLPINHNDERRRRGATRSWAWITYMTYIFSPRLSFSYCINSCSWLRKIFWRERPLIGTYTCRRRPPVRVCNYAHTHSRYFWRSPAKKQKSHQRQIIPKRKQIAFQMHSLFHSKQSVYWLKLMPAIANCKIRFY